MQEEQGVIPSHFFFFKRQKSHGLFDGSFCFGICSSVKKIKASGLPSLNALYGSFGIKITDLPSAAVAYKADHIQDLWKRSHFDNIKTASASRELYFRSILANSYYYVLGTRRNHMERVPCSH